MHLNQLTYLVVDDLELMRALAINQLRAMGCTKIHSARNGMGRHGAEPGR